MFGRPVLLSIAAAAIGSVLSVTDASASCYSCGCGTPVVYSYTYASPCAPRMYYLPPMYVVNQGPAYTLPVPVAAEPTPVYPYVGVRPYGATAYADEGDEAEAYPRGYRHHRHYGHDRYLDRGLRHHGRPHIGMRHLYGERHRRLGHMPHARMMHMQHRMQMQMRMSPRLAPGVVHPQRRGY
jgi:hypothetical protein